MSGVEFLRRLQEKGITPHILTFGREHDVYRQGEPGISLFFLLEGNVALTIQTPEGRTLGLAVLGPGDVFGELALMTGERYVTAHALTKVRVAVVRADETRALAGGDPDLLSEVLSLVGKRLQTAVEALSGLLSASLGARVARHLLNLAVEDPDTKTLRIAITQEELAHLVGATREAVNRELRRLARRELLSLGRGRIVILRPQELSRLAESGGEPGGLHLPAPAGPGPERPADAV
jgi:CRP/FNR family cyclic AMP-dependent transcriptional regulator